MYTISKTFTFAASHRLDWLPPSHKCHRLHGHNYEVTVWAESPHLDADAFVIDYGDLNAFEAHLDNHYDHQHLNTLVERPTAEVLAKRLYEVAEALFGAIIVGVEVRETPNTSAHYRPSHR